jgi:hypothetical protein
MVIRRWSMKRTVLAVTAAFLLAGGGWMAGQQVQPPYGAPPIPPDMRTGGDLGFRVREMKDGRAIGTLYVRAKTGEWVEAHPVASRGFVVPLEVK